MNHTISEFEKTTFRSFWNDGLLDLMFGLVVLLIGISWWRDMAVLGAVFPAVCASLWHPLRKRLVVPRMGYVEFSGDRELKVRSFRTGLISFLTGTMAFGVVVFVLWKGDVLPRAAEWIAGFPLVLIGIPAVFFAVFTQCKRFAVYALFLFLAGVEVIYQGWEPHVGLIASGVFISVIGLWILLRFLWRYPARPLEAP
jgi:hypothetical protein